MLDFRHFLKRKYEYSLSHADERIMIESAIDLHEDFSQSPFTLIALIGDSQAKNAKIIDKIKEYTAEFNRRL